MYCVTLTSLEKMCRWAGQLALALPNSGIDAIILHGALGCGKTTLTQALVGALPDGNMAEISSPSFTIFHCYPTKPPVVHCDLYRCQTAIPEDLLELLEDGKYLAIVEWGEFLPSLYRPGERLDIFIKACKNTRVLTIEPVGKYAQQLCVKLNSCQHCV